jgi:hypothetical protein
VATKIVFQGVSTVMALSGESFPVAGAFDRDSDLDSDLSRPLWSVGHPIESEQVLDFRLLPAFSGLFQPFQSALLDRVKGKGVS